MSKTNKTPKNAKATAKVGAQRTKAVAEIQATDAAANAHAVKPTKGSKTTTFDAGGEIMVDGIGTTTATPAKATKTPAEKRAKKVSSLDAAAHVLADKDEPMTCKAIVDDMLAKGLWSTHGKTPAATIYSAMLREIDEKPGETRFTKTGRGLFAIAPTKKA
jgi:hypothetical protein